MLLLIFVSLLVLLSSGLCSCSEAALFSISEVKVRARAQQGNKNAMALLRIQSDMSSPISAIVILNNIANITGSMFIGKVAASEFGNWEGVFVGCFTFLVIICSEIIPKTLGEQYSDPIAYWVARPVLFVTWTLSWLIQIVKLFTMPFSRKESAVMTTNENEIRMLASMGSKQGAINHNESVLISKVLDMDDVKAVNIMTPRVMMTCLEQNLTLKEARDVIIETSHSRLVLIDEVPDKVVGVLYKTELLVAMINKECDKKLSEFCHKVKFVPEQASADNLLRFFQASRQHLAIVTDQYSGVAGVVTLEDVLECLTGEIVDETDIAVDLQKVAKEKRKTNQKIEELNEENEVLN
ncbi:MAG: hemolysin family protein [Lentisphaeraceae bacterium]|nr:hemolysin family protein [Lentisphaeraceae bacterium]